MGIADTTPFPTYSLSPSSMDAWFKYQLGHPVPAMVAEMSLDHIVYKIDYNSTRSLFAFLEIVHLSCIFILTILILFYILLSYLLATKKSFRHLRKIVWFYALTILHDVPFYQKQKDRFLALLWTLMISVVFINYYCGELVTSLTTKAPPKVIDSWHDLANQDSNIPIVVIPTSLEFRDYENEPNKAQKHLIETYFNRDSIYYKTLTNRIKMITVQHLAYHQDRDYLYGNASEGKIVLLTSTGKNSFEYEVIHFEDRKYKDKLHVSKFGGDIQPVFLTLMNYASVYDELFKNV